MFNPLDSQSISILPISNVSFAQNFSFSVAALPGDASLAQVEGLVVSGGTQHPELSYELAKFLTNNVEVSQFSFGGFPARKSIMAMDLPNLEHLQNLTPEIQATIDDALMNAAPWSELRYFDYVDQAVSIANEGTDVLTALQTSEQNAINDLTLAQSLKGTPIVVNTPELPPELAPGEIALNFGVATFISPLPNSERWNQLAADFAASDPEVGRVTLDEAFTGSVAEMAGNYDCFFMPSNHVADADLTTILNLDPFLDADPTFDASDVVGNTMAQLEREGRVWAAPMTISPIAIWYDAARFQQAGVPSPADGWNVTEFTDALRILEASGLDDRPPFTTLSTEGNYVMMLIGGFGGLPLDYRVSPPMPNFTDPDTVEAIRQVLNLAKEDLIGYTRLGVFGGGGGGGGQMPLMFPSGNGVFFDVTDTHNQAAFPQGNAYNIVSYSISAAYISASSAHPEACYRWISAMMQDVTLFAGMPPRRSIINSSEFAATTDEADIAYYNNFADTMADSRTIILPDQNMLNPTTSSYIIQYWLYRAFDRYVLENADLDAELETAQTMADELLACVDAVDAEEQGVDCAVDIDPSLSDFFGR
jgi:ABC-type glycerol-3-phosphate transport system substrate-binding protein